MRMRFLLAAAPLILLVTGTLAAPTPAAALVQDTQDDPTAVLVSRLTLENYKATLKGLTQFGDRRQGTERNRNAIDWIEAQLQAVGCTNTERITYQFDPAPRQARPRRPTSRHRPVASSDGMETDRGEAPSMATEVAPG